MPYQVYTKWVEPGFFVMVSVSNGVMGVDIHWLFRYYLPGIVGAIATLTSFVAGKNLTRSNIGGGISALLVSFSYVQIDAVTESYYRQIFASVILVMSLVYLDKYLETRKTSDLALFTVLASGTVAYHIAVSLFVSFAYLISLIFFIWTKDRKAIRSIGLSIISAILISAPAWIPRFGDILTTFIAAISTSVWRTSTLSSGEGLWAGGGAIPSLFWSYPHILVGYLIFFFPLVVFSIMSYYILWTKHKLHYTLPALSIVLWFYIGLWLFFGNRFILNLDLLLCVIAPFAIVYFYKNTLRKYGSKIQVIGVVLMASVLVVPSACFSIDSQLNKAPYIKENTEAIDWIEKNMSKDNAVIFAPDYLSADLIQLGYLMAVWDFSLTRENDHPMAIAEEFMLNAPTNLTYIEKFLTDNPAYKEKEIYVLWGTWDLDRPLVVTKKLIPVDDYASSPYFKCVYHGYAEILCIYKYVGHSGDEPH
ncbi:MAG: hypothetical protein QHH00_05105 [Methanomassiliicoccales archaeon]|nr:hypothetical protein [Methanomassiliicoccales archaeon]